MKLTWFGGTTMRVHIGGSILVVDAALAPTGVSPAELTGGADRLLTLAAGEEPVGPRTWRPRSAGRLLDETDAPPVECWSIGPSALVIDAPGEPPLVILAAESPMLGRWADRAVVVLLGSNGTGRAATLLDRHAPRLLALGLDAPDLDRAFTELPPRLDGTGLLALEQGLAVEV
ncbi:hypothetical protein ACFSX5_17990 [Devosia albogilva]|uniref:MBL fold metallo-hydrolase n=1 Tax=Devosia albogilva TaxID=429726 RepID=A0ABW5QQD1_9HYPH